MTEYTQEQRDALNIVANLGQAYDLSQEERHALSKIIEALPEELTKPPVFIPSEPGTAWADKDGDIWVVNDNGEFYCLKEVVFDPDYYAPFIPMVPKPEPITLEQIITVVQKWGYGSDQMLDLVNHTKEEETE